MPSSGPAEWRLEVADGPNAGACLALPPGSYRVGRDPANDIVLSDPAIANRHAVIEVTATGARLTSLQAGGTSIRGRQILPGPARTLRATSDVRLGDTLLRMTRPLSAASGMPLVGRLGACALVGMAVATATFIASSSPASSPPRQAAARSKSAPDLESARNALAARIAGAGLAADLRVSAGEGGLLVAGTLAPGRQPAWQAQQAWFDQHYAGSFALVTKIEPASADDTPALDVAAVALAPVANIITRTGEHYTEGAITPDGWSIVSITTTAIVLQRGTREMRITL